ncbi:MAG: recombinase family protein [Candidatus Falkowbacteria bacterium]|nr:recombinase family protein [Candidatus Falkowbacteria bacterium]
MNQTTTTLEPKTALMGRNRANLEVLAPEMKYCLYARKSSEEDERQALSIDSQIKEMLEMAVRDNIQINEIRKESHSAKDSGQRPVYNQLLADIREGVFNGVLCWAPDRLSRNAGDLGSIVDLMDQGRLIEIRTHGQRFTNSPNEKFLLMILGSQAKLENDHKGENVKRGLRAKCEQGWRPGRPPIGYLHDKYADYGQKKVFLDPKRAPIVKQIFEKMAHEQFSCRKIYRWLKEETDFRTKNDKFMTISMVQLMIREPFYYGEFEYPVKSNKWYRGGYDPIISKDLYTEANERLKRGNISRHECKEFAFTKLIKCGHCGSGITADEKFKKLSDGSVKRYVYYGCARSKDIDCKGGYLREEELVEQLVRLIDKLDINMLGIKRQFNKENERYYKFSKGVLGKAGVDFDKQKDIDIRNYAKYVLREGLILEKREVLGYLKGALIIKNKRIFSN